MAAGVHTPKRVHDGQPEVVLPLMPALPLPLALGLLADELSIPAGAKRGSSKLTTWLLIPPGPST